MGFTPYTATFQSPMGWLKEFGIIEHLSHEGDTGHVPIINGLVEGTGTFEHAHHVDDIGDIPTAYWNITISLAVKEAGHVGKQRRIPLSCMLQARQPAVLPGFWFGKQQPSAHAIQLPTRAIPCHGFRRPTGALPQNSPTQILCKFAESFEPTPKWQLPW